MTARKPTAVSAKTAHETFSDPRWVPPDPKLLPGRSRTYTLFLRGHIPSKANCYLPRAGKGRKLRLNPQAKSEIEWLIIQANQQRPREAPFEHPMVTLCFRFKNPAQDRDNAEKTILDVLQEARIISNDNVRHFNGWIHKAPAELGDQEGVTIYLDV